MKYLIDTKNAKLQQGVIIYKRPTPWLVFFSAFIRHNKDIAFIDLCTNESNVITATNNVSIGSADWSCRHNIPKDVIRSLMGACIAHSTLTVNNKKYMVYKWSFINLCIFCLESISYGYLKRVKSWRWSI